MKFEIMSVAVALVVTACGGDKTYDKISTTRVRPPVQENLPDALLANGSFGLVTTETDYSKTCQTDASQGDVCQSYSGSKRIRCIIKNRLFCKGPTEVLKLLDGVDGRLAEIEQRSSEGEVACMSSAAVDLTSQITFPGGANLTSKYKCQDSNVKLGFGDDADGAWYVREANGAAGQAFQITKENLVTGYIWLPTADGTLSMSTGLLHIRADKEAKTVEFSGGGVGLGFCGIHFHSNPTNIYITMNPDGVGSSCDFDSSGTADASDWVEACLDATTLDDADSSKCTALKTFSLKTLARAATTGTGKITSWQAAAPNAANNAVTFELNTYLKEIFTAAGKFEGVAEFKADKAN